MQPLHHHAERCSYRTRLDDRELTNEAKETGQVSITEDMGSSELTPFFGNPLTRERMDHFQKYTSNLMDLEQSSMFSNTNTSSWTLLNKADLDDDSIFGSRIFATPSEILAMESRVETVAGSRFSNHARRDNSVPSTPRRLTSEEEHQDSSGIEFNQPDLVKTLMAAYSYPPSTTLQPRPQPQPYYPGEDRDFDLTTFPGEDKSPSLATPSYECLPSNHHILPDKIGIAAYPGAYEDYEDQDLTGSWSEIIAPRECRKMAFRSGWVLVPDKLPVLEGILRTLKSSVWKTVCDIGDGFQCVKLPVRKGD